MSVALRGNVFDETPAEPLEIDVSFRVGGEDEHNFSLVVHQVFDSNRAMARWLFIRTMGCGSGIVGGGMMSAVSAEDWAVRLGLTPTDLFGFETRPAHGRHYALLNGVKGSFLLSYAEDEISSADSRSWAWSSNIRHHVAIEGDKVVVTSPAKPKKDNLPLSQVDNLLEKFFIYLETDEAVPSVNVIDHFVRLFRSHMAAKDKEIGCDAPRLVSFLALLAKHMFIADQGQCVKFCKRAGIDGGIISTFRDAYVDRFYEELENNSLAHMRLSLPIALRHAGGALFQETHAEVCSSQQLTLFGLPGAERSSLRLESGAYYTPPGLARAIVEMAIQPHLERSRITLLDPACGSGLFLCEAVRALQRANYNGTIRVYGFDIDDSALHMANFALGCAQVDWPGQFKFSIQKADFLHLEPVPAADVVVMNPPFRKWELLSDSEKSAVAGALGNLYKGRPDLSMVFVSKALEALTDEGTLGTLLPLGILSSESAAKWRRSLLDSSNIRFISSLGDHSLFTNAIVSVTAMILDRGTFDSQRPMSLLWSSERPRAASEALRHYRRNMIGGGASNEKSSDWSFYQVKQADFSRRKVWLPLPNSIGPLLDKISNACKATVADIFDVKQGIRTGCRNAFIISESELHKLPKREREYFRPVAENQTIVGGTILPSRYVFYGASIEDEEQLIRKCPRYRERYLVPNIVSLKSRKGVPSDRYWQLTRHRPGIVRGEPRIVGKMFGRTEAFGLDLEGHFAVVQAYAWIPKRTHALAVKSDDGRVPQKVASDVFILQAYVEFLNSQIFYMTVREFSVLVAGGQYELAPKYVKEIPMPNLGELLNQDPYVADLANQAISTNDHDARRVARNRFAAYVYGTSVEEWPLSS